MECYLSLSLLSFSAVIRGLTGEMFFDLEEHEKKYELRCPLYLQSCFPSKLEWAELEDKLVGTLVWPEDSLNYTEYNYQYNLEFITYPMVHVVCRSVEDIQNAVRFAKNHNLRVTIKSSGSELWGRSSAHCSMTINLMEMKYIHVNNASTDRSEHGEVTFQTGLSFVEVYKEVDKYNRVVVGGYSARVSPGGLISGGGIGPLTRTLGLVLDNVLEIKVVLAEGSVATCTHNKTTIETNGTSYVLNSGELFWAIRGGGSGTFGVVVHYVLKLHQAPEGIVSGFIILSYYKNESDGIAVKALLETFDSWARTASSYWGFAVSLSTKTMIFILNKLGPWDENTDSELKPFLDLQARYPIKVKLENHTSFQSFRDTIPGEPPHSRVYPTGALVPPEKHNSNLWDVLVNEINNRGTNEEFHCYINLLGGKISEFKTNSSSIHPGVRRAVSNVMCSFRISDNEDDGMITIAEAEMRQKANAVQFAAKLRKFGDGAYINMGYVPSPEWKLDFWGEHYNDLLTIQIRYDPDNFFTCYHCVGSDREDIYSSSLSLTNTETLSVTLSLLITTYICRSCL